MAQQPTIEPTSKGGLRPVRKPAPPKRWSANRPGDFAGPNDPPRGDGFGTPGPDTGYALKLLAERDLALDDDEDPERVRRSAVHLVSARASSLGRAPSRSDIDVALAILGLNDQISGTIRSALGADRKRWVGRAAHGAKYGREMVATVKGADVLTSPLTEVVEKLLGGARPLG